MKAQLSLLALSLSALLLTGCSTVQNWADHSKTFRNREMDYTRQNVTERAALKTPQGLEQPNYQPTLDLAPHHETFKPTNHVVMTPPHYGQSSTQLSLQSTLKNIQNQIKELKADQNQPVSKTPPKATTEKPGGLFDDPKPVTPPSPNKQTEVVVDADWDVQTKPTPTEITVDANWDIETQQQQPAPAPVPQPQPVVKNPLASVQQPSKTGMLPVQMNKDSHGVPYIVVNGNYDEIWQSIDLALQQAGYHIQSNDQPDGYFFITPANQPNAEPNLLYVEKIPQGAKLIVYNQQGNPASTALAENVLSSVADFITKP